MPGESALAGLARARTDGVCLHPGIMGRLESIAGERRISVPLPM